jgi:hypothetical protein
MSDFRVGQRVRMAEGAREQWPESPSSGVVVRISRKGHPVVLHDRRKMPNEYSPEFWEPVEDEQSPPGGTPNRPPDLKDSQANATAGPAAQSPQVGAEMDEDGCCVVCGRGLEPCYACAEPGRSVSDRPSVNPPVASADPELAKLLREARNAIDELHGMYAYADLLTGIDSALSRLAGQSAIANESEGAARGSPEEDR